MRQFLFAIFVILFIGHSIFADDSILVSEYLTSPSTGSTTTKYGLLTGGNYVSKIQNMEGFARLKGLIITDGTAAPTTSYINQSAGGTSTTVWHGTDTVTYVQTGNLWRGEIDFPIFGRFARITIGGFGNATFFSVNFFITNNDGRDIGVKWLDSVTTIGTTTAQLAPQSSSRKYILIVNEGTANDCYISGNNPVVPANSGILVAKNNGYWEESKGVFYDAIYGVTINGTTTIRITEIK